MGEGSDTDLGDQEGVLLLDVGDGSLTDFLWKNNNIIIYINCNWVVTQWQWLFYMCTNMKFVCY
jgi:hypothetical protein